MKEIYHRVSIRKYTDEPVKEEDILQILKAAMQAPSTANQQPWEFYVVTDKAVIRALSETSRNAACAAGAPVVIVTAYRTDVRLPEWAQIDLSIAMENMWLQTDALGLGGVWLGIAPSQPRMEAVQKIIGMPEHVKAFGLFALGYPAEEKEQQDRWNEERVHWVK
ncbi:MAG: nitroreductase family protein [Solobacterium sp.]|nr:nitroreductase family protein [Solobacterium sp.]